MRINKNFTVLLTSCFVFVFAGLALYQTVFASALRYSDGTYINLHGSGTSANQHIGNYCDPNSGKCGGKGDMWVIKWVCKGKKKVNCEPINTKSQWSKGKVSLKSSYESVDGTSVNIACGDTVQIDVFPKQCDANGGWDCGIPEDYMVWYRDCSDPEPTNSPTPTAVISIVTPTITVTPEPTTPTPTISDATVTPTTTPTVTVSDVTITPKPTTTRTIRGGGGSGGFRSRTPGNSTPDISGIATETPTPEPTPTEDITPTPEEESPTQIPILPKTALDIESEKLNVGLYALGSFLIMISGGTFYLTRKLESYDLNLNKITNA